MENHYSSIGPASDSELQKKNATTANPPVNEATSVWSEYNIEILNTMSASHINLRKERDTLINKVECVTNSNTKLEEKLLVALQNNKRQLSEIEDLRNKKVDADHWKKSVLDLTERIEKKKSILRGMNKKVQSLVRENRNLQQNAATSVQMKSTYDDRDRSRDEITNLRKLNEKIMHDKNELKNMICKMENEIKSLNTEMSNKNCELTDARNKEIQVRRIAKKYKDAFYELQAKEANLTNKTLLTASSPMSSIAGSSSQENIKLSPAIEQGILASLDNVKPSQEINEEIVLPSSPICERKRPTDNYDNSTITNKKPRPDDTNKDDR